MANRRKTTQEAFYTEPTLHNYDGDLTKRWFINFYVYDPKKDKYVRKRLTSINNGSTYKDRMEEARFALRQLKTELRRLETSGELMLPPDPEEEEINVRKLTLLQAVEWAIGKKKQIVGEKTCSDYNSFKNVLEIYLKEKDLKDLSFLKVNEKSLYAFFDWLKDVRNVKNKTWNNYHTNLSALYNVFVKRKLIDKNPLDEIPRLRAEKGGKHKPYTITQLEALKNEMMKQGAHQLFLFTSFIYYTFARPGKEIRFLKVENILEKTIFIPAEISKNGIGEHVIIPPGLEKLLQKYNIRDYPGEFYVFGKKGLPGPMHVGENYFGEKHREVLKAVNLHGKGYDIYGYKHTGNIALFNAGADIKDLQKQNRHNSIEMTDNYLRDLGLIRNDAVYNNFPEF